ncbi:transmembrane amino acid transporter protein [Encephalitozoon intestinalis ATCC 50506]|uniref:Transmembrane amino acid transporter protein n=1 Tax=Encephalitozoon intestinalis (strain ATCC 50506) TaxID=876142 RepID=E0S925_ENCIT|nr:transmembrane amino acid transporter protein [Encephalitozoon intestinalis ATCC 50506]ADM12281.1 transmembrane amino acid transporter protein [Encephalitozoon intestinalis ATCC 50506]UTX46090.1 transmembrane amino acid transporter protein [Encephalitozoon intestinalis]
MATTLASGYVTLLKTSIGSGILSFPYLFKTYGILTGIALTMVSGFFSVLGLILYAICSQELGRTATLSRLATESMPYTRIIVDLSVFLKCFGVALSYLIITRQLLPVLIETIFGASILSDPNVSLLAFISCIGPFAYFNRLDKLKYTSLCGVIAIVVVVIASLYRYEYTPVSATNSIEYFAPLSYAWAGGFGKFVFSFTCHQNIFAIHSEMEDNSFPRMKRLIYMVASSAAIIYISFGILNYLLYGKAVKDNVLENYPNDVLASVVRGLYIVVMGVSYPLQVNPCRSHLINIIAFSQRSEKLLRFAVTTGIIISTCLLAVSGMSLGIIYSVIGATASTFMCLIFPALFYFNMNITKPKGLIFLSYTAFLFGIFVFSASLFSIILRNI